MLIIQNRIGARAAVTCAARSNRLYLAVVDESLPFLKDCEFLIY